MDRCNYWRTRMNTSPSLTPAQQAAIAKWEELDRGAIFGGTTPESLAARFAEVNQLMETDPEKARSTEKAWFAICGFSDPGT